MSEWIRQSSQRIRSRMDFLIAATQVPGAAVGLREGGETTVLPFGLRDVANQARVESATVFEAASLSKPAFCLAVLRTIAMGKLGIDQTLAPLVTEPFAEGDPEWIGRITPRHVLSHTTGWPNWRPKGKPLAFMPSQANGGPGTAFGYSGEGYVFLQRAMENLWGLSIVQFMEDLVFAPLGMGNSGFVWRDAYENKIALPYDPSGNPMPKGKPDKGNAAWSLHTTPGDYLSLISAFLTPGFLGEDLLAEALRPHIQVNPFLGWALGWGTQGAGDEATCWHWGDNWPFKCFVCVHPKRQRALVVFTNGAAGMRICREVVREAFGMDHPAFYWGLVN